MTNQFPRVTAILDRIPDAATRWPSWMWPCCPLCLTECDTDSDKVAFCADKNCDNYWQETPITPIMRFCPITDSDSPDAWHGGDLDPRNMHHLWAMLEAVCDNPEIDMAQVSHWIAGKRYAHHYNPNIIEAMLRCLGEATR